LEETGISGSGSTSAKEEHITNSDKNNGSLAGRIFSVARRNFQREGKQTILPILTIATGAMLIFVTQVFTIYLRSQAEQIASLFGAAGNPETILSSTYWISTIVLIIGAFEALIVMSRNVVRRTREIGIMKAVGISPVKISSIIEFETFFYGVIGGLVGIAGGFVTLLLLSISQLSVDPLLTLLPSVPSAMLYSFVLAVIASVLAGLYPALRAVRLSVLEALAHDEG
jgi:ABC-type antimicrobial peptide transport system permease subunit